MSDLHVCGGSGRIKRNAVADSEVSSNDTDVFSDWVEPIDLVWHGWGWSETQHVPIAEMRVRKRHPQLEM